MPDYAAIVAGCFVAAILCVAVQFCVKRLTQPRQYGYFRDLLLGGAWLLLALWFGSPSARVVVGGAFLAGIAGLGEGFYPDRPWRLCGLLIGVLCALWGPSIHFIRFADGEYIYLLPAVSLALTALWFFIFPLVFRHLDTIPGLLGYVLAVTFALMLMACMLMGGMMEGLAASGAFFMAFAGLALLGAFWSRFGNAYRQAGRAMSSMWSVLVAGTAILGNSKGIVFSSLFFLSLGIFAIPIVELSLHWVSRMFTDSVDGGAERLYRHVTGRGLEHPEAVRFVAGVCALVSVAVALLQTPPLAVSRLCWGVAGACALAMVLPLLLKQRRNAPIPPDPELWGVPFDNVSMNYAVSRARGLILNPRDGGAQLVATVNALGMEESIHDEEYRRVLQRAAMVLADGTGLLWGMRFLGMPIQERVTGIDFAEQLCRAASAEGWPVYFLGAKGDTAQACAAALSARYPGLIVAGARDGYFDLDDARVPAAVAASGARILLVAMGLPRQEKWVSAQRERLGPVLAVGVGGAFDVFSGRLSRAPAWAQRMGLEWLYRLFQEPFRWRRDLGLARFVLRVLASKLRLHPVREAR